jgi:hypothetical protein
MSIVAQFSWDDIADPAFENPARKIWRDAIAEISERAKQTLPACNGRVDRAVKIVLAGDVELLEDGTAKVASQSNCTTKYFIVNGECSCKDFASGKAPSGWCAHRISAGLAKRAHALTKQRLEQLNAASNGTTTSAPEQLDEAPVATPVLPLPEAPASANCYVTLAGRQIQLTLRDQDEQRLLQRLETLLQQFPVIEEPKEPAQKEGWCSKHNVQMKLNHGKRGSWWSHKLPNGQWCNQK